MFKYSSGLISGIEFLLCLNIPWISCSWWLYYLSVCWNLSTAKSSKFRSFFSCFSFFWIVFCSNWYFSSFFCYSCLSLSMILDISLFCEKSLCWSFKNYCWNLFSCLIFKKSSSFFYLIPVSFLLSLLTNLAPYFFS
jgi:hypothetical protein